MSSTLPPPSDPKELYSGKLLVFSEYAQILVRLFLGQSMLILNSECSAMERVMEFVCLHLFSLIASDNAAKQIKF